MLGYKKCLIPFRKGHHPVFCLVMISFAAIIMSCNGRGKKHGTSESESVVIDTLIFDTTGISRSRRAGDVAYLNKKRINNDLILVNDGSVNNRVYLMDKNAEILHEWPLDRKIGKDAYLMPNGNLLTKMMVDSSSINFGGQAGLIQILAPDGTVEWEFTHASDDYITHHDAELLPNGNILTLVWEKMPEEKALQAGSLMGTDIYPEAIIEVDTSRNEIVWEWHAWDHLVQEVDDSRDNYGIVARNPQLINLNYVSDHKGDIMHANGIAYDPERDLIFLTINWYSEVWVIDHSTSRTEAASHSGGNYACGGDLVYRFGNPSAHDHPNGKRLFDFVHSPIFSGDRHDPYGHMLLFSNRTNGRDQSMVYEVDLSGKLILSPDTFNEPKIIWSFTHPDLYGGRISGASRQSNGNTLITEGDYGIWEVTPDKEVVWKYMDKGSFLWRSYPFDRDSESLKLIMP
ncbi:MAG TPA: aryl-sulfate sulfotransferase [Eudoraea sp.]|nr:aryl-sulfate sulfotransferase [Eudoraea sp.]